MAPGGFRHSDVKGRKVKDSPVGPGEVTNVSMAGYPEVNYIAVAWLEFDDGEIFDPSDVRTRLQKEQENKKREKIDDDAIRHLGEMARQHLISGDICTQINLMDVAATYCGWNPLVSDEKMTIHYGDKEYIVHRTK